MFGPTGETVIVMHDAQPVEIDIKTHQIVREFEKVPNYTSGGGHLVFLKEKGWLIDYARSTDLNGIKNFVGQVFWEVATGKIIMAKQIQIILSDGIKCFSKIIDHSNDKEYLGRYDVNTWEIIDSIEITKGMPEGGFATLGALGIIPNSNKVLLGVDRYSMGKDVNGNWERKYNLSELYMKDFDTKELTKIPIPYETWQTESHISSISVSETGKYNIVSINIYDVYYYYFFDRDLKFQYKEDEVNLRSITGMPELGSANNICFVKEDYFTVSVQTKPKKYQTLYYDIVSRLPIKIIDFHDINSSYKNNLLVILGNYGKIGSQTFEQLPVQENTPQLNSIQSVNYKDSNLVINTINPEKADITITDYKGNLLTNQKDVYLHSGINNIKINLPLANGVYFCVIKTNTGSNSIKFLVNK